MKREDRSKIIFSVTLRDGDSVCTYDSDSLSDFQTTKSWWMLPEIEYAIFLIDCPKRYSHVFNTCSDNIMDIEEKLDRAISSDTLEANISIISNMIFDQIVRNNPQVADLIITRLI